MCIPLSQRPIIAAVAPSAGRMPCYHTYVWGECVTSRQTHRQLSRRCPGNTQWLPHHAGDLLYEKRRAVTPHAEVKFRLLPLSAATLRAKAALQVTLPCAFADQGKTEDLSKLLSTWLSPPPPKKWTLNFRNVFCSSIWSCALSNWKTYFFPVDFAFKPVVICLRATDRVVSASVSASDHVLSL